MPPRTVPLWWEATAAASLGAGRAGRSVLLVPDAHRCAGAWPTPLTAGLAAAGHRPVLVDLRDQGRSPWWESGPADYALADVAADLTPVASHVAALDGRAPVVVGHGFGASVAVELAARHPQLVGGLVPVGGTGWFVDPTLPGPDEPVAVGLIWRSRLADAAETAEQPPTPATPRARASLARALARELRLLCTPDDDPGAAAALAEVERWLAWGFNPADRHRGAWVAAPPAWTELARRSHPLAAVHGRGDPFVPLAHGERLAAEAGASLRVVGAGGHALTPAFVPEVLAAVEEVAASSAAQP